MKRFFYILCVCCTGFSAIYGQEDDERPVLKNQLSTNLLFPFFGSADLNYERTLGRKLAIGLAGAYYGKAFEDLTLDDTYGDSKLRTKYEIMPFARVYFGGNQKRSHFLEVFGSVSQVDQTGRKVRINNEEGNGVYVVGTETFARGGFGMGYGYRFLFLQGKLVAEAQLGIRTNFDVNFVVLNASLVRTGIKIGYRF